MPLTVITQSAAGGGLTNTLSQQAAEDGASHAWMADEGTGTTISDSIGADDFTASADDWSAPTTGTNSLGGTALDLYNFGTFRDASQALSGLLPASLPVTIEAFFWIATSGAQNVGIAFSDSTAGVSLEVNSSLWNIYVGNSGEGTPSAVNRGWMHAAAVFASSTDRKLYAGGGLVAEFTSNKTYIEPSSGTAYIGRDPGGSTVQGAESYIKGVVITPAALTPSQIAAHNYCAIVNGLS